MDKNYYEILQVDKNASDEVIEKVYKMLVKKYHPDLQEGDTKKQYEEKMKEINEAYAVISDSYKRSEYDKNLQEETISVEDYKTIIQENLVLKEQIQQMQNFQNNRTIDNNAYSNKLYNEQINQQVNEQVNRAVRQAYQDAYIQDLKNRGYKIRYKRTLRDYKNILISIVGTILVFILILQIPFVKKFFNNLYEENFIIKILVDTFKGMFSQKF